MRAAFLGWGVWGAPCDGRSVRAVLLDEKTYSIETQVTTIGCTLRPILHFFIGAQVLPALSASFVEESPPRAVCASSSNVIFAMYAIDGPTWI